MGTFISPATMMGAGPASTTYLSIAQKSWVKSSLRSAFDAVAAAPAWFASGICSSQQRNNADLARTTTPAFGDVGTIALYPLAAASALNSGTSLACRLHSLQTYTSAAVAKMSGVQACSEMTLRASKCTRVLL
eukprot:4409884-Amphidinium_carterae.1